MNASFPGENLSLARSDCLTLRAHHYPNLQPKQCKRHANTLTAPTLTRTNCNSMPYDTRPPVHRDRSSSLETACCVNLLQQYAAAVELELVLGHLAAQCVAVDAKQFGGVSLVVPRLLECFFDGLTLDILEVEGTDQSLKRPHVRC